MPISISVLIRSPLGFGLLTSIALRIQCPRSFTLRKMRNLFIKNTGFTLFTTPRVLLTLEIYTLQKGTQRSGHERKRVAYQLATRPRLREEKPWKLSNRTTLAENIAIQFKGTSERGQLRATASALFSYP